MSQGDTMSEDSPNLDARSSARDRCACDSEGRPGVTRSGIRPQGVVMSEPSVGNVLLQVALVIVAMNVIGQFEAMRIRIARARRARREQRPQASERKAA